MASPKSFHRRRWLSAASGLWLGACTANAPDGRGNPPLADTDRDADAARFRIPGEFEAQRCIWLGYDPSLHDTTAALVQALAPFTPLNFLVPDERAASQARELLAARGLLRADMGFHIEPLAMYYPRDGAVFALAGNTGPTPAPAASATSGPAAAGSPRPATRRLGMVDLQWNQYGMPQWCQRRYAGTPEGAGTCTAAHDTTRNALDRAMARLTGAQLLPSTLALEGGGIESNGQGLLIACEALVRSRNPGLNRAELQQRYLALPGVKQVIWLPEGLAHDPHLRSSIVGPYVAWGTGGHTDEFVRFAAPRTVLLAWPDDVQAQQHPVARLNRERMQRNAAILAAARTADGQALRVLRVPMPRIIERQRRLTASADRNRFDEWTADFFPPQENRREGDTVIQVATASYLNFVIANGVVVLPDYLPHGTPREVQARVQQVFEQAFGGRAIRFVDAASLNWLGGGLHCATLHEPLPL